jgi:2-methylcitrate dehydratase PrpD
LERAVTPLHKRRSVVISADVACSLNKIAYGGLPRPVHVETIRSIVNVVGTSIGAARSEGVNVIIETAVKYGDAGLVPVPGRLERVGPMMAALAAGTAAHMDDFDDTHLATIVHAGAAVVAAAIPVVAMRRVSGDSLVTAVALGIETELRFALAMTPWHYDAGWHITGTVGVLGAAVTSGVLLELDDGALAQSLNIASSLCLGHRESFGTMLKPFHPGKAAVNGLLAAHLANAGATASAAAFEDSAGYFETLSSRAAVERVSDRLGEHWELLNNTYKPFPCGIVSHPAIEAAELLHRRLENREPAEVRVICHPLVVELTRNPNPRDELSARFSTPHGVAAGLADGVVGPEQYELDAVHRDDIVRLRAVTRLIPRPEMAPDAARVEISFADGQAESVDVVHVRGSRDRPMSDAELDDKVARLIERTLRGRGGQIIELVRNIDKVTDCNEVLERLAARPGE